MYLNATQIRSINENALNEVLSLEELALSMSTKEALRPVNLIQFLNYIDDNLITNLPTKVFKNLKKLKILSLNQNRITKVPANVFSELSSLEKLFLSTKS